MIMAYILLFSIIFGFPTVTIEVDNENSLTGSDLSLLDKVKRLLGFETS